jgi:hypothetical protein
MKSIFRTYRGLLLHSTHFESFEQAFLKLQEHKIPISDIFSPHPLEDQFKTYERKKFRAGFFSLIGGLIGTVLALIAIKIIHNSYPMIYSEFATGTFFSFIPVIFVLCILFAALFLVIGFFVSNHLLPGQINPVLHKEFSSVRYGIFIESKEADRIDMEKIQAIPWLEIENISFRKQEKKLPFPIKNPALFIISLSVLFACSGEEKRTENTSGSIPETSIPFRATGKDSHLSDSISYKDAGIHFINPIQKTKINTLEGQFLYDRFCIHCHGSAGKADAIMIREEKHPPPPHFTDRLQIINEGQAFYSLYYGNNYMPAFNDVLSINEIWTLVNYIQKFRADEK